MQKIVLGGGCFWCLEAVYEQVKGVTSVVNGYSGGHDEQPNYESVSSGRSGHAEVVEITYDENQISLAQILEIFWSIHDPTTPNQQGADVGSQYRSAIYYNPDQKPAIDQSLAYAHETWGQELTTEIKPLAYFYPAEAYHQQYFQNHPEQGYCQIVINPKLHKFRTHFSELLKPTV